MKKVLALLFLLTSLCFGSEFKKYEDMYFYECVGILNNLNKDYLVVSYKIIPSKMDKGLYYLYTVKKFNMVVEIEKIETYQIK